MSALLLRSKLTRGDSQMSQMEGPEFVPNQMI